jgi:hypothetical protein
MKKIIYTLLMVTLLVSCKTADSSKLDSKTTHALRGNYTISSVTFEGNNMFKINVFEIADSKCFEGSTWNFIANNNKGSMALNAAGCPSFESKITWFINKEGNFVLKILDDNKARKVTDGYVLGLKNVTDNGFQLVESIRVGGKMTDLVYQFNKN